MKKPSKLKELLEKLSEKYNLPIEAIDKFEFLYFELIKRCLLDGKVYSSASFGRFYGKLKGTKQIPPGVKITSLQFYMFYHIRFKPTGEWAFRAGSINSSHLFEYCSRAMNCDGPHARKWFNPSYCSYIDRIGIEPPQKILEWRAQQKKKDKKDKE